MTVTYAAVMLSALLHAGAEHPDADAGNGTDASQASTETTRPTITHVAGATDAQISFERGVYRLGLMSVSTPLPEGYPRPTAPGVTEIKVYPSVRRAEFVGDGGTDQGRNSGFFPLFRHISARDIAMTAPVEMDLLAWDDAEGNAGEPPEADDGGAWRMSFLYRTEEDGPEGRDGRVLVRDVPPVTVLARGTRGPYSMQQFDPVLVELKAWIDESDKWEQAGPPRWMGYNGPAIPASLKWGEVQFPIRPTALPDDPANTGSDEQTGDRPAPTEQDG